MSALRSFQSSPILARLKRREPGHFVRLIDQWQVPNEKCAQLTYCSVN
jgi:hypothetical protein